MHAPAPPGRVPRLALAAALLLGAGSRSLPGAGAGEPAEELHLEEAIGLALTGNPRLAALRLEGPVLRAGVEVARERRNPELGLELEKETPRRSLSLALPLDLGGKRDGRIEVARAAEGSGEAAIAEAEAALRVEVRRAYFELAAREGTVAAARELEGLAERAAGAARERFEAGDVARLEVLGAELAVAEAANRAAAARAELGAARVRLNALLGRPPGAPIRAVDGLDGGALPEREAALAIALGQNASLRLAERRLEEARARIRLARAEARPDPVLSGTVTHDAEPEFEYGWRVGAQIELPILTRYGARIGVAELELARAEAEREAAGAEARAAVEAALERAAALREVAGQWREQILPRTRELEDLAQESYRAGKSGLPALLQSLQSAREARLAAIQAGLDYQLALAELEGALGAPLPGRR